MKKVLTLLVLLAHQLLISDYEDSLKGYWHGVWLIIQIKECEEKICGVIEFMVVGDGEDPMLILDENNKDKESISRTLIGSNILYDIDKTPDSKRTFTGKIYNPEEGKSYKSKINTNYRQTTKPSFSNFKDIVNNKHVCTETVAV